MQTKILYLFTRTPLHVGAGASVGAIDQPVQRERHTGFPIIPASSLKGTFADAWNDGLLEETNGKGEVKKVRVRKDGTSTAAAWLFGSDSDQHARAGTLQFTEARLLAFPIRSVKGSFAWITSPLILRRAQRDGVIPADLLKDLKEPSDDKAILEAGGQAKLALGNKIVIEEYTFESIAIASKLGDYLGGLMVADPVWTEIASRLVILSDGMMSFFAQNACEVAQHVRISDETGTAEGGALFNQENVPSETLFYAVVRATDNRNPNGNQAAKKAEDALEAFASKLGAGALQFGGDASTGLGYCSVKLG
jgi:CRISPR-associated protein Cmr4